jgi:dynein heavy chain, axonemal
MTYFLEVEDVRCASPATVSRCGMVFIEPDMLRTDVHFESWYRTLPENITDNAKMMKKLR